MSLKDQKVDLPAYYTNEDGVLRVPRTNNRVRPQGFDLYQFLMFQFLIDRTNQFSQPVAGHHMMYDPQARHGRASGSGNTCTPEGCVFDYSDARDVGGARIYRSAVRFENTTVVNGKRANGVIEIGALLEGDVLFRQRARKQGLETALLTLSPDDVRRIGKATYAFAGTAEEPNVAAYRIVQAVDPMPGSEVSTEDREVFGSIEYVSEEKISAVRAEETVRRVQATIDAKRSCPYFQGQMLVLREMQRILAHR